MSIRYKGGIISATPPVTTTSSASGAWTLEQQMQAQGAGTWPSPPIYVEDVFSTYLYTGTGATQTVTNGIDLSGSGGLVWMKNRTAATTNSLYDTARGATAQLISEFSSAQSTQATGLTAFNSNGFTIGALANVNTSTNLFTSWTFRKQSKFFDMVTYTGTGVARTISHNLNATPGFMLVKRTDTTANWACVFGSGGNQYMVFNDGTSVNTTDTTVWNGASATSSVFPVGTSTLTNASAGTYVAYLFAASSSGGFGLTGSDSIVATGSAGSSSGIATITLGWEPQWILCKWQLSSANGFFIYDVMRGMSVYDSTLFLKASNSGEDNAGLGIMCKPNATGFTVDGSGMGVAGQQVNYLAIRRGPMKLPTVGTSVFSPISVNAATGTAQTTNFVCDMQFERFLNTLDGDNTSVVDRLRGISTNSTGAGQILYTSSSATQGTSLPQSTLFWNSTGFQVPGRFASVSALFYSLRRAPSFFDIACYTGNGSTTTGLQVPHNLGVTPQLILCKKISPSASWGSWASTTYGYMGFSLNSRDPSQTNGYTSVHTSTYFNALYVWDSGAINQNANTNQYVAYLFATLAGVSKVGRYTGTGALQTIDCGFTTGARFVLIKCMNTLGDWWVFDSVRGLSSSTDPYFFMNTTSAQVTGTNYVDTDPTGFKVTAAAPAGLNGNADDFIFLAIA